MSEFKISEEVRKQKSAEISKLTNEAEALIREAEDIAQEFQIEFSWDLAYGMGGHFGQSYEWGSSNEADENGRYDFDWNPSSQSC